MQHPRGSFGDALIPTSRSALPASHTTAFESPDTPGALPSIPEPNHEASAADGARFQWGHVPSESHQSLSSSDLIAEEPQPLSTPTLSPSEPVFDSRPQSEAPAKLSADWKLARIDSAKQTSPLLKTLLQPGSNTSVTSMRPPTFTRSTTPQLTFTSDQKSPDDASEQTRAATTSPPAQPLEPLKLEFADSPSDESYILDHVSRDLKLPGKVPRSIDDRNQLSPSSAPMQENKPVHYINILPNPDEILAPSYHVPFIAPHSTSPSYETTEVSPEDFYPTNTMELDWGSGDYMETMSFLNSEGDDYYLVTKVPSDSYDTEDYTESYDTSFPSRLGISLSSLQPLHISPSPSLMTAYSTVVPLTTVHPSSPSSIESTTTEYTLEPTPSIHDDIADVSDIDWADTFSIQPTHILLPDMNSLEYYTTQLTKENSGSESEAEQRGNVTVESSNTTDITPTSSSTNDDKLAEDESSSDLSGFEPFDETTTARTTEKSPELVNVSEPFLHPSIGTTSLLDPSSSVWAGQAFTSAASLSLVTSALTTAIPPVATPLLPDDVTSSLSLTDVQWFVTESHTQSTFHSSPVLTATTVSSPVPTGSPADVPAGTTEDTSITTEQALSTPSVSTDPTFNVTSVPPVMVGDQGVADDEADIPATTTLIPASSVANTVSAAFTTTTASTTSRQAVTGAAEASTSVDIVSSTGGTTQTTTQTSKQYLCNRDRPDYLVKIGTSHFALCICI